MKNSVNPRTLAKTAGFSYLVIFFAAIFANFMVLESIIQSPVETIEKNHLSVRLGIMAFLITVVFDVVVAWALKELFKEHKLTTLSTYFRMMHAGIMGVAIFALVKTLSLNSEAEILGQVDTFNIIWLIGLFFFGVHLILLGRILKTPKIISIFLMLAGAMYIFDTSAHFLYPKYDLHSDIFLAMVAIPSILGEMSFAIWLLVKGGKH